MVTRERYKWHGVQAIEQDDVYHDGDLKCVSATFTKHIHLLAGPGIHCFVTS